MIWAYVCMKISENDASLKIYRLETKSEAKPNSKKGHNSVKFLQMICKFVLDLYLTMLYPSVNFE